MGQAVALYPIMISLFGVFMILGIVVDGAIVVSEAIYFHRKQGDPPIKAAVVGVSEVGMPVMATVATSIMILIPLFNIDGIMDKLTSILPEEVIARRTI